MPNALPASNPYVSFEPPVYRRLSVHFLIAELRNGTTPLRTATVRRAARQPQSAAGKRRAEALHNLAERTRVEELKKLVAVLIQTDRFGTSIAQSLRGHSDYMRVMARQRAEERAGKLAVKLVFPIFFCVLPSLFVVTVGPVLTRLVRDLIPMIENM